MNNWHPHKMPEFVEVKQGSKIFSPSGSPSGADVKRQNDERTIRTDAITLVDET